LLKGTKIKITWRLHCKSSGLMLANLAAITTLRSFNQ
jgi:hypothetical protein